MDKVKYRNIKDRISARLKKERDDSNSIRPSREVANSSGPVSKPTLKQEQQDNLRGFDANKPDRTENESYNKLDNDEELKKVSRQLRYLRQNS